MNRQTRRAHERRLRAALRRAGCTCDPVITADSEMRSGIVEHEPSCVLELQYQAMTAEGLQPVFAFVGAPACTRSAR